MFGNIMFGNVDSFFLCYEGEDTTPGNEGKDKTFTQDEVNAMMAKEAEKVKKKNEQYLVQLKELQTNKTLSEKQQQDLQNRINELETSHLSSAEKAKLDQERIKTDFETKLKSASESETAWKNKYTTSTIRREISDAAVEGEAYHPTQIVTLLEANSRLVEDVDPESKEPNGNFVTKIKFTGEDKHGKPVTLDLTPKEAIKAMKEMPKHYGNLFKTNGNAGLGGTGNAGTSSGKIDIVKLAKENPEKYRELRKKGEISLENV